MRRGVARGASGFTLMELAVVIGLLGLVGLGFAFLYVNSQRYMVQGMVFSAAQGEASFGLEHIKRQLLQVIEVTEPAMGAAPTNQLTFRVQRTVGGAVQQSRYLLNTGELRFIPNVGAPGTFEVVARGVTALTFTRLSETRLAVDLTARQASAGGDVRRVRLRTEVGLRGVF